MQYVCSKDPTHKVEEPKMIGRTKSEPKFCVECGAPVIQKTEEVSQPIWRCENMHVCDSQWQFCPICGSKVEKRGGGIEKTIV